MALKMEMAEMGWDLSLRAQSRSALATNSVWLQEEGNGMNKGSSFDRFDSGGRGWDNEARGDVRSCIDPILE
ncbi:hypothetical protein Gorai_023037 [Gossypium raimondii]|uniref:Uncharacterized protein n=1 Tax=Gossypium raimondii TaxID=29730 RepID=A0A7J8NVB0_GOSRA|nr:hypothetical protein [Gossypium raimondii]